MARCITTKKNSSFGNERIILYLHPADWMELIYDKELDLSRSPPIVCTDQKFEKKHKTSQARCKIIVPHFSGPEDIFALCQSLVSCSHNNISHNIFFCKC